MDALARTEKYSHFVKYYNSIVGRKIDFFFFFVHLVICWMLNVERMIRKRKIELYTKNWINWDQKLNLPVSVFGNWKLDCNSTFSIRDFVFFFFLRFSLTYFTGHLINVIYFIYLLIIARMFIALSSLRMPDAQSINYLFLLLFLKVERSNMFFLFWLRNSIFS